MRIESFPLSRDAAIPTKPQDVKPMTKPYEEDGKDKPERDGSKDLNRTVEKLNKAAELFNNHVRFKVHKDTGRTIVQVIENGSDKVLAEFPPEKALDMEARIHKAVGIVLDKYV